MWCLLRLKSNLKSQISNHYCPNVGPRSDCILLDSIELCPLASGIDFNSLRRNQTWWETVMRRNASCEFWNPVENEVKPPTWWTEFTRLRQPYGAWAKSLFYTFTINSFFSFSRTSAFWTFAWSTKMQSWLLPSRWSYSTNVGTVVIWNLKSEIWNLRSEVSI